jgi:hypothetical protein
MPVLADRDPLQEDTPAPDLSRPAPQSDRARILLLCAQRNRYRWRVRLECCFA